MIVLFLHFEGLGSFPRSILLSSSANPTLRIHKIIGNLTLFPDSANIKLCHVKLCDVLAAEQIKLRSLNINIVYVSPPLMTSV